MRCDDQQAVGTILVATNRTLLFDVKPCTRVQHVVECTGALALGLGWWCTQWLECRGSVIVEPVFEPCCIVVFCKADARSVGSVVRLARRRVQSAGCNASICHCIAATHSYHVVHNRVNLRRARLLPEVCVGGDTQVCDVSVQQALVRWTWILPEFFKRKKTVFPYSHQQDSNKTLQRPRRLFQTIMDVKSLKQPSRPWHFVAPVVKRADH